MVLTVFNKFIFSWFYMHTYTHTSCTYMNVHACECVYECVWTCSSVCMYMYDIIHNMLCWVKILGDFVVLWRWLWSGKFCPGDFVCLPLRSVQRHQPVCIAGSVIVYLTRWDLSLLPYLNELIVVCEIAHRVNGASKVLKVVCQDWMQLMKPVELIVNTQVQSLSHQV